MQARPPSKQSCAGAAAEHGAHHAWSRGATEISGETEQQRMAWPDVS